MKAYFMMVVGAAVMSAFSSIVSPEKWRKYIQLVTGIIILCCISAPVAELLGHKGGFNIPEIEAVSDIDAELHRDIISEELNKQIESDIEERMKNEYGANVTAKVIVGINENNEITGVERISIRGDLSDEAKARLCEIYGVDMIYEE